MRLKRPLLHLAFWVVYLFQDTLLIYLVDSSRLPLFQDHYKLWMSVESCLLTLIPKLLFTYFMLYVTLRKIVRKEIGTKTGIVWSLGGMLAAVLLYRATVVFVSEPVIYGWKTGVPSFWLLMGFLVGLMDIGFASGLAIVIKLVRLQLASRQREELLVREKMAAELQSLRNQVHPHFLFNTLNNIYALARKKADSTPAAVARLSSLLRFMLYETKKPSIAITDEIRIMDDYIALQQMRYDRKLTVNFFREVDDGAEQISPLLLLPFVENAFKHGVGESRFGSFINIDLRLQGNQLRFEIENNKEMVASAVNGNIGLANVKRRLELMYDTFDMLVDNAATVFRVCLTINLKSHAKI